MGDLRPVGTHIAAVVNRGRESGRTDFCLKLA